MAENKKSFVLYADMQELFFELDNETAGLLIKHVMSYVNDEHPITDNQLVNIAFISIKRQLKRDLKKWEETRKKRSEAGKKGMEKRWNDNKAITKDNNVINAITKITVNDNVNVTVNDINNNYNKFVDEVKNGNHDQAIEQMYMRLKLKPGALTPLLKTFKGQLLIDNTLHKNTLELRKHFNNWLNMQEKIGKLAEHKKRT